MADAADDPFLGQLVNGKYRIVAAIGRGGMGNIYRAEQMPLGRSVALKVLRNRPGVTDLDPAFQRRFFLEASLCSKLSHPNIVTVFDYGQIENAPEEAYFMAMELLEGETLHQRLRTRGGSLPAREAVFIATEIARGLREAHKHGIIHRDLKPGNVMIVSDGESGEKVKIVDFGLVKQTDSVEREDLTQEGSFLGSPRYMSPEQIQPNGIDHRADLYSLGVILFQCLCGRVPFDAPNAMQILLAHVSTPVPSMKERNPDSNVPASLEAFCRRLLAKNPASRFASADEVIREIRLLDSALAVPVNKPAAASAEVTKPSNDIESFAQPEPSEPSGSLAGASFSGRRIGQNSMLPQSPRKLPVLLVAVGMAGLLASAVVVVRMRPRSGTRADASSATGGNQRPPGEIVVAPAPPTLSIDSTPPGASVSEQGRALGVTPLQLPLQIGQTARREFTIASAGYVPYVFSQEPSRTDVRVAAVLVPESPAPAVPVVIAPPPIETPHSGHRRPRERAQNSGHAPAAESSRAPMDIRMER